MVTLEQVYYRFPDTESCLRHLEQVIWEGKPVCPYCGSGRYSALPRERRYHCNACNRSYSVTVNTLFHKSRVGLQKWFFAFLLLAHSDEEITARRLAALLNIHKNSAWLMLRRIRKAVDEGFSL